ILKEYKLTGISVAIVDDYKIIHAEAAGLKEFGTDNKIDTGTAFSTASVSKAITGIIAAMLAEEGVLDLDAPVSMYLKRWHLSASEFTEKRPITIRHLLTHTAGTSQSGFADFYPGDDIPTILESLNGIKLPNYDKPIEVMWSPQTRFKYSGGGFVIAQVAMEDATGKTLAQLAQEMLFQPLGMKNSSMEQVGHPDFPKNVAKAHNFEQKLIGPGGILINPQIAAGGLWSSAVDMAKLVIDIQKALAGKPSTVVSPWVANETTRLQTLHKAGGWSLGWARNQAEGNIDWFSHLGYNTGIGGAVLGSMNGGKAIIAFGNGVHRVRVPAIDAVIKDSINVLGWKKTIAASPKKPTDEMIQNMVGTYQNLNQGYWSPFHEVISIKETENGLVLQNSIGRRPSKELIYVGDGKFRIDQFSNAEISLQINPVDNLHHLAFTRGTSNLISYPLKKTSDAGLLPFEIAASRSYGEALAAYKTWQANKSDSTLLSARNLILAGKHSLSKGNTSGARNFFKVCLALHPDNKTAKDLLASLK
ncbi:MAG: serine hydrolase domain-containing protein, partial [Kordiimonas sp.]